MRTFFAIDIPPAIEKQVLKTIASLKKEPELSNIKWTKAKNLHITLRFLGEITLEQCQSIEQAIKTILQKIPSFQLQLKDIRLFPSNEYPIALVLTPTLLTEITALALSIDTCVNQFGVAHEKRPFSPHLTLARIKNKLPKLNLAEILSKKADLHPLTFPVNTVKLLRSEPTPLGSNYTVIKTFKLI